jgi:hypothetical protein
MKWLLLLLGVLAGATIGAAVVISTPALQPSNSLLATAHAALIQKDAQIQSLQSQLAKADSEKTVAQKEQEPLRNKIAGLEDELKQGSRARSVFNSMMSMGMDSFRYRQEFQIVPLKSRLNLTPEQEAALRRFFDEEANFQEDVNAAAWAGKNLSEEEKKQRSASLGTLEEKLRQILNPVQMKSYQEFQDEDRLAQNELSAHRGMNEISSLFPLDEEQKTKTYDVFYEEFNYKWEGKAGEPIQSYIEIIRQRHAFLKDKLSQILTRDQVETWSKLKEGEMKVQQEMTQTFLPNH